MISRFHPAVFLGAVIVLCAVWLSMRPPVSAIETVARREPRPAPVVPTSIELDQALLERYVGRYEGRGGFTIDLALKRGKLFAQGVGTMPSIPYELRATSETEFYLMVPGSPNPPNVDVKFDISRDGTVRGFAAQTEYGLIELERAP